jgi:endonuclease YncB( thermonuclease family)
MASTSLSPARVPETYAELRAAVELTLIKGQQEVDQAKVRTYWDTGRLIHEHVLLFKERADYGAGTIAQLSADLKYHRSTLQRCVQFYLAVPNCASMRNLAWAHYTALIPIENPKLRRTLAAEANRSEWSVARLRERIAELAPAEEIEVVATPSEPPELLKPNRGTPGLHVIVEKTIGPSVDLGFRHYWPLTPDQAKRFSQGNIVRIASDDSIRLAPDTTKADLFTYAAQLVRVVDGDTLVVALEVSPGEFLEQKLRLRGLDCPEMNTPEGRAAKRFVEALMTKTTAIVINTTKPDKYDRYLADVFLVGDFFQLLAASQRSEDGSTLNAQPSNAPLFLNNALLSNGHAVRKDAEDFGDDWGFR